MTNEMGVKNSEQTILNTVHDPDTSTLKVTSVGFDGVNTQREPAKAMASKITVSGSVTYIGIAAPGTAQSTAKWQVKKVDQSVTDTTVITWADGNASFDNVATDLTALTYS